MRKRHRQMYDELLRCHSSHANHCAYAFFFGTICLEIECGKHDFWIMVDDGCAKVVGRSSRKTNDHATFDIKVKIRTKSGMREHTQLPMGVTCNNFNWFKAKALMNAICNEFICDKYAIDPITRSFTRIILVFVLIEIDLRRTSQWSQTNASGNSVAFASVCCVMVPISTYWNGFLFDSHP